MALSRLRHSWLVGATLVTVFALTAIPAAAAPRRPVASTASAAQVVLTLQITGAYHYSGTLSKRVAKQDTACLAGKSGTSLAYAVGFNAAAMSGSPRPADALALVAGVKPYRTAVAVYRGNRTIVVNLLAGGTMYIAGPGVTPPHSLEFRVGPGGLSGTLTGTHLASTTHRRYVDVTARWRCPRVLGA